MAIGRIVVTDGDRENRGIAVTDGENRGIFMALIDLIKEDAGV